MAHPIRVDNSEPATVRDTARTLGVSKKRTDELVREVRRMLHRDQRTGDIPIRGKRAVRSRKGNAKVEKTTSTSRKVSR